MMQTKQVIWETDTHQIHYAKNPRVNIPAPARSRVEQSRQLYYKPTCGKSLADLIFLHEEPVRARRAEPRLRITRAIQAIDDLTEADNKKCGGVAVLRGTLISISYLISELAHDKNITSIAKRVDLDKEQISGFLKALAEYLNAPVAKDDTARIVETPNVCGGDARIRGTRIPVWTLEVARRDGCSDVDILGMYPVVDKADLSAAWEWVSLHRAQIESAIRENEEE